MEAVGREIRRLRKARGWTGAELAVYAGMAPSAISQIETGRRRPNAGSLDKIAEALGVEVRDLFPKEQPPLNGFMQEVSGAPVWDRPEEDFLAWLADTPREEVEQLREQVGELLGDYQERYGPGGTHGRSSSFEVAKAHSETPEGRRGRLLHRRALQLARWSTYLEERARRDHAVLAELEKARIPA